ncbi:MAG: lysine--tRNA ligase [Candidatus Portnoybacteria bacterium]|nr:lysine--tRNA ligase [Candidatus Portnoybacteria bacterium]
MKNIDRIRKVKIEKLNNLIKAGMNPYPAKTSRTHSNKEALDNFSKLKNKKIYLAGRIRSIRQHGGSTFCHIEDGADAEKQPTQIQAFLRKNEIGKEKYDLFIENIEIGDFVEFKGSLFKTKRGEKTIEVKDWKILSKTLLPLPEEWYGLKDTEERYRKRYLDLIMNPETRDVFKKRSQILKLIREFLDKHNFLEVETPILQPMYGGASAKPFTTHLDALNTDLYLRISDELYLKRLIVGGFEKVYEVSKDFRNEGIDRQHSPEFTQIEFYWAYANYEDLMKFTEKMICFVVKEVCQKLKIEFEDKKISFKTPWRKITYRDLILKHTKIDINKTKTEKELREEIRKKKFKIDFSGIAGYGPILDTLYKEYCRPKVIQPTFITDHPAELMPLAKRKKEDPSKIESFQLLIYGYELIKAYSELNDPQDQKQRWLEQEGLAKKGLEEYEALDEEYIQALEHGMPPTAGFGIGIDRLTAILTNQHSIRDVILFPFMRPKKKK